MKSIILFYLLIIPLITLSQKNIPGRIEAESWTTKSASPYNITTTDSFGVQQVVGIIKNSWMQYKVNVTQPANYIVSLRIATPQSNAMFQIEIADTTFTMPLPATGEWNIWKTVTISGIKLDTGSYTMKITSIGLGSANFNWIEFASPDSPKDVIMVLKITEQTWLEIYRDGTFGYSGLIMGNWFWEPTMNFIFR